MDTELATVFAEMLDAAWATEGLMEFDISSEQWREYEWEGRSTPYRINSPVTLYLRKGGSTHRVVDADGVAHCVPTVGERGCILRWKNLDGVAPVNF